MIYPPIIYWYNSPLSPVDRYYLKISTLHLKATKFLNKRFQIKCNGKIKKLKLYTSIYLFSLYLLTSIV